MNVQEIQSQITGIQIEMNRISSKISDLEEDVNKLELTEQENYRTEIEELKKQLKELNIKVFKLESLLQDKIRYAAHSESIDVKSIEELGDKNINSNLSEEKTEETSNYGKGLDESLLNKVSNFDSIKMKAVVNSVKKDRKEDGLEQNIGKNVMGVLASVLIFIGLCSLGALVFDTLDNTAKALIIHLISFAILGVGLWRAKVDKNAFSLSLSGIGLGSVYIAIIFDYILGVVGMLTMGILLMIWSLINLALAYMYKSTLYTVISYIGFNIAITLGFFEYSNVQVFACGLFLLQLLYNCVIIHEKGWESNQCKDIMSYLMLFAEMCYTLFLSFLCSWDYWDDYKISDWCVIGGIALLAYIIYAVYCFYKRHKEDKNFDGLWIYMYASLFMTILVGPFINLAFADEWHGLILIILGVLVACASYYIEKYLAEDLKGSGLTCFYHIAAFLSLIYLFCLIEDTVWLFATACIAYMFISLFYQWMSKYNTCFLNINAWTYLITILYIKFFYVELYLKEDALVVSFLGVVALVFLAYTVLFGMHMKSFFNWQNVWDKLCVYSGYFVLLWGTFSWMYVHDFISTRILYSLIMHTLLVIWLSFALLSGYCTDWDKTKSLFKRLPESVYDLSFYFYRLLSYIGLSILLGYMYTITDNVGILLLYTVYAVLLCCLNTKYILNTLKRYSGYILGFKFTVFTLVLLNIYTSGYEIGIVYSLLCLIIAITCILLGFYYMEKSFRVYGLFLSIISVLKFVFVDIAYDNSIYRILGYIFGGVLCLVIVAIYNKLEMKQKE